MGTNQVQKAVEDYERTVKQAAKQYEDVLRDAELKLREAMSSGNPEPPADGSVMLSKDEFEHIQQVLNLFEKVTKENPGLFQTQ